MKAKYGTTAFADHDPSALVGARVSMLMIFAPFLGNTAIPARIKSGRLAALTILLYPSISVNSQIAINSSWLKDTYR